MFIQYNANPAGKHTNDCTIRAISKSTGKPWRAVYSGICMEGYESYDMPSSNAVWGAFLKREGYKRMAIPNTCPDCYTVMDFCKDHPKGNYILGTGTHVIAVIDGDYYDTWQSGEEIPIFYWERRKDHAELL